MKQYLNALRLKEIIGKAGFFMVGVIFSKPDITIENFLIAAHFFFICLANGIAIYLINAGLGHKQDLANERLYELHTIKDSTVLRLGYLLVIVSMVWLYFFSLKLLLPALATYLIWILYSLPKGFKGIPFLGLVCAFTAQIFHFHLGYLVFSDWSRESVLLSAYFALLFAGGHALHEVIDYEADKKAGLRTSAVYFGRKSLFKISNYIFGAAALLLVLFGGLKVLPWAATIPYLAAFAIQLWRLIILPANWSIDHLFVFRRKYMTAYLLATGAVIFMFYYKTLSSIW